MQFHDFELFFGQLSFFIQNGAVDSRFAYIMQRRRRGYDRYFSVRKPVFRVFFRQLLQNISGKYHHVRGMTPAILVVRMLYYLA